MTKWIRISDTLPDEELYVLVVVRSLGGSEYVQSVQLAFMRKGKWIGVGGPNIGHGGWPENVTHWMSIPELPDPKG